MAEVKDLIFLNLLAASNAAWDDFVVRYGGIVVSESDSVDHVDVLIVDSQTEKDLIEKYQKKYPEVKRVYLDCTSKFVIRNVQQKNALFINSNQLATGVVAQMLVHSLHEKNALNIDQCYGDLYEKVELAKLSHYLSWGEMQDAMSIASFSMGANPLHLRSALCYAGYYLMYLKESGKVHLPIELQYAESSESIICQFYCDAKDISIEYITECFGDANDQLSLSNLASLLYLSCDLIEFSYIEDLKKLKLSLVWTKNNPKTAPSLLISNIKENGIMFKPSRVSNIIPLEQKDYDEQVSSRELPDNFFNDRVKLQNGILKNIDLHKIALYAASQLEEQSDITRDQLMNTLERYPNQDYINSLSSDDLDELWATVTGKKERALLDQELESIRNIMHEDDQFQHMAHEKIEENLKREFRDHDDGSFLTKIVGLEENEGGYVVRSKYIDQDDQHWIASSAFLEKFEESLFKSLDLGENEEEKLSIKKMLRDDIDQYCQKYDLDPEKLTNTHFAKIRDDLIKGRLHDLLESYQVDYNVHDILDPDHFCASSFMYEGLDEPYTFSTLLEDIGEKFEKVEGYSDDEKENMVLKTLGVVEKELGVFSNKIGLMPDDLSEKQLRNFKRHILPKLISQNFDTDIPEHLKAYMEDEKEDLAVNIRSRFDKKLIDHLGVTPGTEELKVARNDLERENIKDLLYDSIKDTLVENFELKNLTHDDIIRLKEDMADNLTLTLDIDQAKAQDIVEKSIEDIKNNESARILDEAEPVIEKSLIEDNFERLKGSIEDEDLQFELDELKKRYQEAIDENVQLKLKLNDEHISRDSDETLTKDVEKKIESINRLAVEEAKKYQHISKIPPSVINDDKRAQLLDSIKQGEPFSGDQAKFGAIAISKESKLTDIAKQLEGQVKKLQREMETKTILMKKELEASMKIAKDGGKVADKVKSGYEVQLKKKQKEIQALHNDLKKAHEQRSSNQTSAQGDKDIIKKLQSEKKSLEHAVEMYKRKIDSYGGGDGDLDIASNMQKMQRDNKGLEQAKQRLESRLTQALKESESYKNKIQKYHAESTALKGEKSRLAQDVQNYQKMIKDLQQQLSKASAKGTSVAQEAKILQKMQEADKKIKEYENKLKASETRAKKLENEVKKKSGSQNSQSDKKYDQLNKVHKRLMKELETERAKSNKERQEMAKIKSEKTRLENEVAALSKALEKHKKAA